MTDHARGRDDEVVEDGFGSTWVKCAAGCTLHVVRPGKAQCDCEARQRQHTLSTGGRHA